jgi:hypothetical protein
VAIYVQSANGGLSPVENETLYESMLINQKDFNNNSLGWNLGNLNNHCITQQPDEPDKTK